MSKRMIGATKKDACASQLTPMAMLIVLLAKHMKGDCVEEDHLMELTENAIALCGSVENAITALETGQLKLDRVS
jgi:hypothetical protein